MEKEKSLREKKILIFLHIVLKESAVSSSFLRTSVRLLGSCRIKFNVTNPQDFNH